MKPQDNGALLPTIPVTGHLRPPGSLSSHQVPSNPALGAVSAGVAHASSVGSTGWRWQRKARVPPWIKNVPRGGAHNTPSPDWSPSDLGTMCRVTFPQDLVSRAPSQTCRVGLHPDCPENSSPWQPRQWRAL